MNKTLLSWMGIGIYTMGLVIGAKQSKAETMYASITSKNRIQLALGKLSIEDEHSDSQDLLEISPFAEIKVQDAPQICSLDSTAHTLTCSTKTFQLFQLDSEGSLEPKMMDSKVRYPHGNLLDTFQSSCTKVSPTDEWLKEKKLPTIDDWFFCGFLGSNSKAKSLLARKIKECKNIFYCFDYPRPTKICNYSTVSRYECHLTGQTEFYVTNYDHWKFNP